MSAVTNGACDLELQLALMFLIFCVRKTLGNVHMSNIAVFKVKAIKFTEKSGNRRVEWKYRASEKLVQD